MMVGLGRLERPTSPLSGVRSNHLSYRPEGLGSGRGSARPRKSLTRCLDVRKRDEGGGIPPNGT